MKKLQLLLLFILAFQQSNAQQGLDSLRLVLPVGHTTYISSILSVPKSDSGKDYILTSDGEINCVWDNSSKKLIYSFAANTTNGIYYSSIFDLIISAHNDTIEVRKIQDGSMYYKLDIASSDFKEDWTNETADEFKLSDDEKSIMVIYRNHKKKIWKVSIYDINSGMLIHSFSGQYFERFNLIIVPNMNFILAEVDNSILQLDYLQEKKSRRIGEFENTIKSTQMINGTNYLFIQIDNKVIVYDLNLGLKKSEFECEYAYFKDSFLITIRQGELVIRNLISNQKITAFQIKKITYDTGEFIEPIVLFSSKSNFIAIKNGNDFYNIELSRNQIIKEKLSGELSLRYVSDSGEIILEEPIFKCLFRYNYSSKILNELFCPDQFDGNGEVNFSPLLFEDHNRSHLFFGSFRQIIQLDVNNLKLVGEFKPLISTIAAIQFDPNVENIIIQSYVDIKQLPINLSSGVKIVENNNFWCQGDRISFNESAELVAIPSRHNLITIMKYPGFELLEEFETDTYPGQLKFSHNDNFLINSGSIVDLRNLEMVFNSENELWIDREESKIIEKEFNSDLIKVRDISSLDLINESGYFGENSDVLENQIFTDNYFEQIAIILKDRKLLFLNINDEKISFKAENWILDQNTKVDRVQFSDNLIFLFTADVVHIFSKSLGKWIKEYSFSRILLRHVDFSQNGKFICVIDENNTMKILDGETNNQIYEYVQLLNNNWLVKLPNSPYYMCSKDASKMLHYVTPSLKVIGFEQLDPIYNRPDIVLDSIGKYFGGADQELVANYRQSWEKRVDRLGLDKEKLGKGEIAVPSAEIVGADQIAYENKTGELAIGISANDAKYPLQRFNVYVNEVPLYGSAGISIAHLNKQVWDTTISVPLSVGDNKIQVSVMNELGLENFKYPTYVNYAPQEQLQAKTYYIGIGVNEFAQSAHNLKYCVKDVRDLAESFSTENSNTDTLLFTNQQVTRENILALKTMLMKTTVNDKVIISCSSHGLLDDSLNFYLAMHDVDFKNPKLRGLKYEELESLLDGIPARQKLLLLDACNSGENDKTELLKKEIEQNQNTMDTPQLLAARGVVVELEEENTNNFKKINELFVNVRNNTGSVIISAAGGQQSALEAIEVDGKIITNGAFTYSILECLKQNEGKELKVNALKQYAEKRVEEITNGKQKPTSRQETMEIDWGVR